MGKMFKLSCVAFLPYLTVYGDSFSTIVPVDIELNSTIKSSLRYGFQKTSECLSFEKSFLCIQKCLDLKFDVAYADKNCKCTCYIKKEKAKYTLKYNSTITKWKLGAPTTSIPPWAQDQKTMEHTEADNIIEVQGIEVVQAPSTLNDGLKVTKSRYTSVNILSNNGTLAKGLIDGQTSENGTTQGLVYNGTIPLQTQTTIITAGVELTTLTASGNETHASTSTGGGATEAAPGAR